MAVGHQTSYLQSSKVASLPLSPTFNFCFQLCLHSQWANTIAPSVLNWIQFRDQRANCLPREFNELNLCPKKDMDWFRLNNLHFYDCLEVKVKKNVYDLDNTHTIIKKNQSKNIQMRIRIEFSGLTNPILLWYLGVNTVFWSQMIMLLTCICCICLHNCLTKIRFKINSKIGNLMKNTADY